MSCGVHTCNRDIKFASGFDNFSIMAPSTWKLSVGLGIILSVGLSVITGFQVNCGTSVCGLGSQCDVDTKTCVCQVGYNTLSVLDDGTSYCIKDTAATVCPPGYTLSFGGLCEEDYESTSCSPGYTLSSEGLCEKEIWVCPPGFTKIDDGKMCEKKTCPSGYTLTADETECETTVYVPNIWGYVAGGVVSVILGGVCCGVYTKKKRTNNIPYGRFDVTRGRASRQSSTASSGRPASAQTTTTGTGTARTIHM